MSEITTDVAIVGAGPAGLAAAIALAKENINLRRRLKIVVLEKARAVGEQNISGAIVNPTHLDQLIPNWRALIDIDAVRISKEKFLFLRRQGSLRLPMPSALKHKDHELISISALCRMLADYVENLGVQIITSCAVEELAYQDNAVCGVQTVVASDDQLFNLNISAQQTILSEGCYGMLSEKVIEKYHLRGRQQHTNYALGVKEIWEVERSKHQPGLVEHFYGYPLSNKAQGSGYLYHIADNKIAIGINVDLNYKNPNLDPAMELQQLKQHPHLRHYFQTAEFYAYGAGCMNISGYQALPSCHFPGGLIIGCSAGLMNNAKMQGIHNAIYSGILAAQTIAKYNGTILSKAAMSQYTRNLRKSSIYKELYKVRNIYYGFKHGFQLGIANTFLEQNILRGKNKWTLKSGKLNENQLQSKAKSSAINYPAVDEHISLSKNKLLAAANLHYSSEEDHISFKIPSRMININLNRYGSPEQKYCPAGVYELDESSGKPEVKINARNCLNCRCCAIKDPTHNIEWRPPVAGGGPAYTEM